MLPTWTCVRVAVEPRYREIFNNVQAAVWEEDFSEVAAWLDDFRAGGVTDLRAYLQAHPDRLSEAVHRVRIRDVNAFAVELFEVERKEALLELKAKGRSTLLADELVDIFERTLRQRREYLDYLLRKELLLWEHWLFFLRFRNGRAADGRRN